MRQMLLYSQLKYWFRGRDMKNLLYKEILSSTMLKWLFCPILFKDGSIQTASSMNSSSVKVCAKSGLNFFSLKQLN